MNEYVKNRKLAILGVEHLLGNKLYNILKREYQVAGIQQKRTVANAVWLPASNAEKIEAYFVAHDISIVLITSEIFCDISTAEEAKAEIWMGKRRGLKVIYVDLKYIMEADSGHVIMKKRDPRCSDIICRMLDRKDLCLSMDCCYGDSENSFLEDVLQLAEKKDKLSAQEMLCEWVHEKVSPVLADEIALWVMAHIDDCGTMYLKSEEEVELREWIYGRIPTQKEMEKYVPFDLAEHPVFHNVLTGQKIRAHQKNCVFNLVYRFHSSDCFQSINIAKWRMELGCSLAGILPAEIVEELDYVSPVPQTGIYYAMGLAAELHTPYVQVLEKTDTKIRSFQIQDAKKRKKILWSKIHPIPELVKGKNIAVVDEAIFTGATLKAVCKMMRECGAGKIYICIPTPKCRRTCDYLVQPRRKMLLEYLSEDMLLDYFDVDGIFFQTYEQFQKNTDLPEQMCMDCFDRCCSQPTKLSDQEEIGEHNID